ncbi:MAG: thioredoxin-dependent thiol peroxidase [Proteobacteria bacterium]|nr:thioredoxin-dependent thiol peroxidase [Pseudomonadota bacterium]
MATKKKTTKKSKKKVKAKKTTSKKTKKLSKKVVKKVAIKKAKKLKKAAKKKVTTKKVLKKAKTKAVSTTPKKIKAKIVKTNTENASKEAAVLTPDNHPLLDSPVPDVAVVNQRGEKVSLKELASAKKNLLLYFYPKDDTPGCTKEACNFRDNLNRIVDKDTVVVGVSPDSPESHQKFIEKYQINFDLLSDSEKTLANHFKVWKEKEFMGNKYWGVDRSTFLFSDGVLKHVWQPVKVEGHVDEVLTKIS